MSKTSTFKELKTNLFQHEEAAFVQRFNQIKHSLGLDATVVSGSAQSSALETAKSVLEEIKRQIQGLTAADAREKLAQLTAAQKFMEEYLAFLQNLEGVAQKDLSGLEFLQDDQYPITGLKYRFADGSTISSNISQGEGRLGVSTGGQADNRVKVGMPIGASSVDIQFKDGQTITVTQDRNMIYKDSQGNLENMGVYANQILDEYIRKYQEWEANPSGQDAPDIHFNILSAPPGAHDAIKKHLIQTLMHRYVHDYNIDGPEFEKRRYDDIKSALERGLKLTSDDWKRYDLNEMPQKNSGMLKDLLQDRKFAASAQGALEDFVKGEEGKAPASNHQLAAKAGRGAVKSARALAQSVWYLPKNILETGFRKIGVDAKLSIPEVGDTLFLSRREARSEMTYFLHQLYQDLKSGKNLQNNPNYTKLQKEYKIDPKDIHASLVERVKVDKVSEDQVNSILVDPIATEDTRKKILAEKFPPDPAAGPRP